MGGRERKDIKTRGKEMSERRDGSSKEEKGGEVVKMKSNKLPLLQCQSHDYWTTLISVYLNCLCITAR